MAILHESEWTRKQLDTLRNLEEQLRKLRGLIVTGGGTAVWGSITGVLAAQADLVAALAGKSDVEHTHPEAIDEDDLTDLRRVAELHMLHEDPPEGEQGPPGPPGRIGIDGVPGPALFMLAEDGVMGDDGPPGQRGLDGQDGPTGGTGPAGPALFMMAEDGEHGEDGAPGQPGVAGVAGASGAPGQTVVMLDDWSHEDTIPYANLTGVGHLDFDNFWRGSNRFRSVRVEHTTGTDYFDLAASASQGNITCVSLNSFNVRDVVNFNHFGPSALGANMGTTVHATGTSTLGGVLYVFHDENDGYIEMGISGSAHAANPNHANIYFNSGTLTLFKIEGDLGAFVEFEDVAGVPTSRFVNILDIGDQLTLATSPGSSGQVLTSAGAGNPPTWQTPSVSGGGQQTTIIYENSECCDDGMPMFPGDMARLNNVDQVFLGRQIFSGEVASTAPRSAQVAAVGPVGRIELRATNADADGQRFAWLAAETISPRSAVALQFYSDDGSTFTSVLTFVRNLAVLESISYGNSDLPAHNFSGYLNLDTGTATRAPLNFDPAGSLMTTPSVGAAEMDADCFYLTTDLGNRGVVANYHYIRAATSRVLTNTTNEQAIFNDPANGRLTLEAGSYRFEALLMLSGMSATSGNASFDILGAGTATLADVMYHAVGIDNTTPTAAAAQTGSFSVTGQSVASIVTAGTGTGMGVHISGTFEISAAGTIIPSIDLVTAAGPTLLAGSFFECRRIGSAAAVSVGQWD